MLLLYHFGDAMKYSDLLTFTSKITTPLHTEMKMVENEIPTVIAKRLEEKKSNSFLENFGKSIINNIKNVVLKKDENFSKQYFKFDQKTLLKKINNNDSFYLSKDNLIVKYNYNIFNHSYLKMTQHNIFEKVEFYRIFKDLKYQIAIKTNQNNRQNGHYQLMFQLYFNYDNSKHKIHSNPSYFYYDEEKNKKYENPITIHFDDSGDFTASDKYNCFRLTLVPPDEEDDRYNKERISDEKLLCFIINNYYLDHDSLVDSILLNLDRDLKSEDPKFLYYVKILRDFCKFVEFTNDN